MYKHFHSHVRSEAFLKEDLCRSALTILHHSQMRSTGTEITACSYVCVHVLGSGMWLVFTVDPLLHEEWLGEQHRTARCQHRSKINLPGIWTWLSESHQAHFSLPHWLQNKKSDFRPSGIVGRLCVGELFRVWVVKLSGFWHPEDFIITPYTFLMCGPLVMEWTT